MAGENQGAVLRGLGRIFDGGSLTGLSEGQLVRRFAAGDGAAFEALVSRCGPIVLGVCRRMLHDRRDVEDAFQATFLVLLRKAGGLRDAESVGPWLHGVAHRVAARTRARSARRPEGERRGARPEAVESSCDIERDELRALIDEEIGRLPEKYRRPVVLCYLEGRTHEEAARRLRCTTGSVRGRLDRARRKLQERLVRRGVAPTIGLAALSASADAAVPVPAEMMAATVATLGRAATATSISASTVAFALADEVFRAMAVTRLRAAAVVLVGVIALGTIPLMAALEPAGRQDPARPIATAAGVREDTASGRVIDDAGRPIAGARVALGSDLRGLESVPEAVTDAKGRFVMHDVPRGSIILTAQARGHAPDLKWVNPGPEMSRVEFRLGPGHTIRGRIVDSHDRPIAGAPIAADEWRVHHSLRWSARTDAEGRFRWDDAPADAFRVDLGTLGFTSKRFWNARPDAPEQTIAMRRPLRVRGRVTDAETGRPITAFTLVPGFPGPVPESARWQNERAREITGLSYDVSLSTDVPLRLIRIEADGYLPGVSRAMKDDEEEAVVHFALRRGVGIAGVVHLPDGSPLAGAEVLLATVEQPARIQDGRLQQQMGGPRIVKTRADGRFTLAPAEPPYAIVALHDRGYGRWTVGNRAEVPPAELMIEPWGRVEGTLRIGRRPGEHQTLSLHRPGRPVGFEGIVWSSFARTDAEGRFTFERVAPGRVTISRLISLGSIASAGGSPSLSADVRPGATARLTVGGTGRAVVGKVGLPDARVGRDDWTYSFGYLSNRPDVAGAISSTFKVEPDGSFRIDDVAAGAYQLSIAINRRPSDPSQGPLGTETIAMARSEVTVPEMPGGRSDEPLDLGTIRATPTNAPEPAASRPAVLKAAGRPSRVEPDSDAMPKPAIPGPRRP